MTSAVRTSLTSFNKVAGRLYPFHVITTLCVVLPSFNTLGAESSQNIVERSGLVEQRSNEVPSSLIDELKTSSGVWRVDRVSGSISVFDLAVPAKTLWSPSGIVYRSRAAFDPTPFPVFKRVKGFEYQGRVYFLLTERNVLPLDDQVGEASNVDIQYETALISFAPDAQGRVVWKLQELELVNYLYKSSNVQEPIAPKDARISVDLEQSSRERLALEYGVNNVVYQLFIDAAVGVIVEAKKLSPQ